MVEGEMEEMVGWIDRIEYYIYVCFIFIWYYTKKHNIFFGRQYQHDIVFIDARFFVYHTRLEKQIKLPSQRVGTMLFLFFLNIFQCVDLLWVSLIVSDFTFFVCVSKVWSGNGG